MTILYVHWEYEDKLPDNCPHGEFDSIFDKSEVRDGVRMYPYVWQCRDDGTIFKAYLGTPRGELKS